MPELTHKGKTFVRFKDNTIFSLSDVPTASTKRWVASRKLNVVRAVAYGLLEEGEAKKRYRLSDEEFISWVRDAANYGKEGLKVHCVAKLHLDEIEELIVLIPQRGDFDEEFQTTVTSWDEVRHFGWVECVNFIPVAIHDLLKAKIRGEW